MARRNDEDPRRPGIDANTKPIIMSAHLDKVFPEGTDTRVRREGTILRAPGVGDDTRGLATILASIRALDAAGVRPATLSYSSALSARKGSAIYVGRAIF